MLTLHTEKELLNQIDNYFDNVSKEQLVQDLKDSGCLEFMEETNMPKTKVILNATFGSFYPDFMFNRVIKDVGIPLWSVEGRTNETYLKYFEEHAKDGFLPGVHKHTGIKVVEVDTSLPWYIDDYDNAEHIAVLDYKVVNDELNFVEMNR